MNAFQLLKQSLRHHWLSGLAIILATGVASAVLTGALFVGDSMRYSLRQMTLERLVGTTHLLLTDRFFPKQLAGRLQDTPPPSANVFPALLLEGTVSKTAQDEQVSASLIGVTNEFHPAISGLTSDRKVGINVIINDELAQRANLKVGDRLTLQFEKGSLIPKESLVGERVPEKSIRSLSANISAIVPSTGVGRMSFRASQRLPRNVYVSLDALADAVGQAGKANALLIRDSQQSADNSTGPEPWNDRLKSIWQAEDLGLRWINDRDQKVLTLQSDQQVIDPALEKAALQVAEKLNLGHGRVLTYLANEIKLGQKSVPYSIVTALEDSAQEPTKRLPSPIKIADLKANEVLINQWLANRLSAKAGDTISMSFYKTDEHAQMTTETTNFVIKGIVAMEGLALDRNFAPAFPGITDSKNMRDWDPPFAIDLKKITKPDEDYWRDFRTAPKVFLNYETGKKLWADRFGASTCIRYWSDFWASEQAKDNQNRFEKTVDSNLRSALDPTTMRMNIVPIAEQDLSASGASTPFDVLFIAFSFFLIVAALMLVGMLFRLYVEQRVQEIGLLKAVGFTQGSQWKFILGEASLLILIGLLIGAIGAYAYGATMIHLLTTWWQSAISTPFIKFAPSLQSVVIGAMLTALLALLSNMLSVRQTLRVSAIRLLRPGFKLDEQLPTERAQRLSRWLAIALGIMGLIVVMLPMFGVDRLGAFFGGAFLLLASGLGLFYSALATTSSMTWTGSGTLLLSKLAWQNAKRNITRSLLVVGLISLASFVVVAVGLMRNVTQPTALARTSGNGGFSHIIETTSSVLGDLNSESFRTDLGLQDDELKQLEPVRYFGFRVQPGEDAGCLNIYQPTKPMLIGASKAFIERGGFSFAGTSTRASNPWTLLEQPQPDDAIPAIGDANTLQWSLKVGVGGVFEMPTEQGPLRLRIVGSLAGSIFQGQLVIAESHLLKRFPNVTGWRYFLLEPSKEDASGRNQPASNPADLQSLEKLTSRLLGRFGANIERSIDRIAAYKQVENTYMASFSLLGGLGLALGTAGLGAVLARNMLERRGELALMQAIGWTKSKLLWLVSIENLMLLGVGLLLGTTFAVLAIGPSLLQATGPIAIGPVLLSLAATVVVGVCSILISTLLTTRGSMIGGLRSE